MIKKTILAAATIAISMAAYQPAAQAGGFKFGIYLGDGYGNGHWGDEHWGGPYKLTCHEGKLKLRHIGYHHILANDCAGKYYNYRVVRGGKIFRIRMNAYTGRYRKTFLGWV